MRLRSLTTLLLLAAASVAFAIACSDGGGDDGAGGNLADTTPRGTFPAIIQTALAGGSATPPPNGGGVTPGAFTPPASQVPPEAQSAVDAVVAEVLRRLTELEPDDVDVISATAAQFSDSCLDVVYAGQDEVCAQVITPGWVVIVHFGDTSQGWNTNEDGSVLRFASQDISTD